MNSIKIIIIIITVLYLASTGICGDHNSYKVLSIIDGETVDVLYNGHRERVRLLNAVFCKNIPEFKHTRLRELLSRHPYLPLKFKGPGRDRLNRLMAYIYLEDLVYDLETLDHRRLYQKRYMSKYDELQAKTNERLADIQGNNLWRH